MLYYRPIAAPNLAPAAVQLLPLAALEGAEGVLRRELLVDLDAPAGTVFDPPVAILELGTASENLLGPIVERRAFLDAEVLAGKIKRQVAHHADGRQVCRAVPCRAHAEDLTHRGD